MLFNDFFQNRICRKNGNWYGSRENVECQVREVLILTEKNAEQVQDSSRKNFFQEKKCWGYWTCINHVKCRRHLIDLHSFFMFIRCQLTFRFNVFFHWILWVLIIHGRAKGVKLQVNKKTIVLISTGSAPIVSKPQLSPCQTTVFRVLAKRARAVEHKIWRAPRRHRFIQVVLQLR